MLDIPDVISDDVTQGAVDPVPAPTDVGEVSADAFDAEGYAYWEESVIRDNTSSLVSSIDGQSVPVPWLLPEDLTAQELLEQLAETKGQTGDWWNDWSWSRQALSLDYTVDVTQHLFTVYGIDISAEEVTEIMRREGLLIEGKGSLATVGAALDSKGIPSRVVWSATFDDVIAELQAGHKLVIPIDSSELWDQSFFDRMWDWMTDLGGGTADRVVLITEIDMSYPDNPRVTINGNFPCRLSNLRDAWADSRFTYIATDITPSEYVQPDVSS